MLNNRGVGRKEMMMALLLLVVFAAILLYKVLGIGDVTKYSNFRRKASNFITAANHLMTEETEFENVAYLYDLIECKYSEPIKSPFNSKVMCDEFESKVYYVENSSFVTLKCGEYAISNRPTTERNYQIYKVSDWTEVKPTSGNFESAVFYNFVINEDAKTKTKTTSKEQAKDDKDQQTEEKTEENKEQLPQYFSEREFLIKYYQKTGYKITSIYALNSKHKLVEKTFYRTYEQVS